MMFEKYYREIAWSLINNSLQVDVGEVHAQDVSGKKEWISHEILGATFKYEIPLTVSDLAADVKPNLPWAENHFLERVSGEPLNPPPSAAHWPYAQRGHEEHLEGGKFSHTYPERFWPKHAGAAHSNGPIGIRFPWGDLDDVVNLLIRKPHTRQAYLPVWFPEDTGNRGNVRVPCTLGYHFLLRDGKLFVTYLTRSCDLVRFFRDDVYMACRLCQWVLGECLRQGTLYGVVPGELHFYCASMHCFEGDIPRLKKYLHA